MQSTQAYGRNNEQRIPFNGIKPRVSVQGNNGEENTVAQMIKAMDITEQDPACNSEGPDEVASHHSFL
jgi:hypothetical protein